MRPCIHYPEVPNTNELNRLLKHFSIPPKTKFTYGTAGFRYHHELLPPIIVRIAIFAALRSSSLDGEPVGLMITASHNPEQDNGLKISDSNGGMLPIEWEAMATDFANAKNLKLLMEIAAKNNSEPGQEMIVHIGRDTRSHSLHLSQLAIRSLKAFGAMVIDHGLVTTPALHYNVLRSNINHMPNALLCGSSGTSFEKEYLNSIIGSYVSLLSTKNQLYTQKMHGNKRSMLVDCACGVGGLKVPLLNQMIAEFTENSGILLDTSSLVHLTPVNLPGDGPLNERCGAEYVQKQQKLPVIYTETDENLNMEYVASFDGDADRIVFHAKDVDGNLVLLDGDKIAVLVSSFLQEEIEALSTAVPFAKSIRCGIVQTAYANGSSTAYLKNVVKTDVVIAKTGVKHVHTAAHHHFDVGTYFEANGHGTVLFGNKFFELLAKAEQCLVSTSRKNRSNIAWQRLRVLPRLVNQAVGDAISDLFLVDAILYLKGWNLYTWSHLYTDMPSRQCKVKVQDRTMIHTNENETKATSPIQLQMALDAAMDAMAKNSPTGRQANRPRAFVRPSGTEDAVRIYAEANSQKDADALATEAAALVYKLCNGTGNLPSFTKESKL